MIKIKKIFIIFVIMLLIVIFSISSYFFIKKLSENAKSNKEYKEIQDIVITEIIEESTGNVKEVIDLKELYEINNDLIGWIKIEGTMINYPIMQNGDFYLRRNIYKEYSCYGTPYIAQNCNLKNSDNLVIYGHHITNGSMFGELEKYKNKSFYNNHKYIKFYTIENELTIEHIYEIIITFKTTIDRENSFKYYLFNNLNVAKDFENYISRFKQLQLYETEKTAIYGDRLITLSTCEYSEKNSRLVIVAKEV